MYLIFVAPSGAPNALSVDITSPSTITLEWTPPNMEEQNGVIEHYRIVLTSIDDGNILTLIVAETSTTVNNLHPHYTYVCSVLAFTVGYGPNASIFFQMPSYSMLKESK